MKYLLQHCLQCILHCTNPASGCHTPINSIVLLYLANHRKSQRAVGTEWLDSAVWQEDGGWWSEDAGLLGRQ